MHAVLAADATGGGLVPVRTCLVVNWEQEEKEGTRASLVEVRTNDLIRDFLRIELVKSTTSYQFE